MENWPNKYHAYGALQVAPKGKCAIITTCLIFTIQGNTCTCLIIKYVLYVAYVCRTISRLKGHTFVYHIPNKHGMQIKQENDNLMSLAILEMHTHVMGSYPKCLFRNKTIGYTMTYFCIGISICHVYHIIFLHY